MAQFMITKQAEGLSYNYDNNAIREHLKTDPVLERGRFLSILLWINNSWQIWMPSVSTLLWFLSVYIIKMHSNQVSFLYDVA